MARIAGTDLPRNKRVVVALTYIYGIGRARAKEIVEFAKIPDALRTDDLSDAQVAKIREFMEAKLKVEGEKRAAGLNFQLSTF